MLAAGRGHCECVSICIASGADVNAAKPFLTSTTHHQTLAAELLASCDMFVPLLQSSLVPSEPTGRLQATALSSHGSLCNTTGHC